MTRSTVPMLVHPVGGALGAEIEGIDLDAVDDALFARLRQLLLDHLVIFIRDQKGLSPEGHIAFGRRFGALESHPYLPRLDGHDEIVVIDSANGDKVDVWHTDMTFHQSPPLASILQLTHCPGAGGDTMWSNQCRAYEALSAPLRDLVDGLTAVHRIRVGEQFTSAAEHPVVRVHPETGRRALYVNRLFTSHIPQLSRNESDAILEHLFQHCESPRFTCRFRWREGDVAVWDNRVTQHYAIDDYAGRRRGQRVTVMGDHPTGDPPRWPGYRAGQGEKYWPWRVNAVEGYE